LEICTKYNSCIIHLDINGTDIVQAVEVTGVFAKFLQPVYNAYSPEGYYSGLLTSEFFQLPSFSELDISKAVKRLRPTESVGLDGTPGFIIKGFFTRFGSLLEYIFDLSLSQEHFIMQRQKWLLCLFYNKCNRSSVSNQRPISLLNFFSKVF